MIQSFPRCCLCRKWTRGDTLGRGLTQQQQQQQQCCYGHDIGTDPQDVPKRRYHNLGRRQHSPITGGNNMLSIHYIFINTHPSGPKQQQQQQQIVADQQCTMGSFLPEHSQSNKMGTPPTLL
ncbi:hypothetical protein IV203_028399 [Nitzschia inconspicua]|uniref:Uncharacterized protein n=1 Tax=Nitzschia inconspicua TaxID=303405 RepID=A0A9K3KYV7_9STRA|nr:hypothetical protein IV203_007678 [Nitzschia inconspicua]KAG7365729.1 hypothetical protein IV203_028399 [Nitzschia inconspicua]